MKQLSIKKSMFGLLAAILLVSCKHGESLQTYFVDNQETAGFTSMDIPTSIVNFDEAQLSEDQKEAYKSVKRLNFLGFKVDSTNGDSYKTEMAKVKTILSDKKYNELIEFNDKGGKVVVKYLGEEDIADEFIVFGSSDELGFGVLRVLGDNMSPNKMITLAESMNKANVDETQLKELANFFK